MIIIAIDVSIVCVTYHGFIAVMFVLGWLSANNFSVCFAFAPDIIVQFCVRICVPSDFSIK